MRSLIQCIREVCTLTIIASVSLYGRLDVVLVSMLLVITTEKLWKRRSRLDVMKFVAGDTYYVDSSTVPR